MTVGQSKLECLYLERFFPRQNNTYDQGQDCIHITSFSLQLTNGVNKLECFSKLSWIELLDKHSRLLGPFF